MSDSGAARTGVSWLGQPPGLTILFLTQMWETFSYYGMRVLLVYYMTKQLLMGQQQASLVYGVYTAMVYFTPIVGGVISDRWLGRRRAVVIGGVVMALGHFLMASESAFYFAWRRSRSATACSCPACPARSTRCTAPTIRAGARPTTSTTSASMSAACWRCCSAAGWVKPTAGTTASARLASACSPA
jgi:POT family proton-dependent oligopeptide transporter